MIFIHDKSAFFPIYVLSIHLSETGDLTSHSVSIVSSSPAPTSTTHSKRPSFLPPFPSTTLHHRTICFFLPSPSPSLLLSLSPSRPLSFAPTWSSFPCSSSARP